MTSGRSSSSNRPVKMRCSREESISSTVPGRAGSSNNSGGASQCVTSKSVDCTNGADEKQRDLSLGMFEIANCFLEGVGVKKAPDVAIAYLRFAANMGDLASQEREWSLAMLEVPVLIWCGEELGFLLSKGASGIKKDMKEAAKWYRMAVRFNCQSSTLKLISSDGTRFEQHLWPGMGVESEFGLLETGLN